MSKIALVFPGQGAQYVGMAKDLYENYEEAKNIIDLASKTLEDVDIKDIMFNGPDEELKKTRNTQPAILTHCIAALEVLKSKKDMEFAYTAGLSLGEYASLVASKTIKFEDALRLVQKRGQYMQDAVPMGKGTMAAILGLEREVIKEALDQVCGIAEFANFNSPGQIVISGEVKSIEEAVELCKEKGAKKAVILNVSAPFHCSMLNKAGQDLSKELENIVFEDTNIDIIANVNAKVVTKDEIKDSLIKQVSSSVMWEDSVEFMLNQGVTTFVEVGPGKTLKSFINRKAKTMGKKVEIININDVKTMNDFLEN